MVRAIFRHLPFFAQTIFSPISPEPIAATSSILLSNSTVISFNSTTSSLQILHNASIHILNDRINDIYPSDFAGELPTNTTTHDMTGKIISPGFIDTHTHAWQGLFKTLGSNTTLAEYTLRYGEFSPASAIFTPEELYVSQRWGLLESLNAGVTTTVDHAHSTWSWEKTEAVLNATLDSGIRSYFAFAFHDMGTEYTVQEQMRQWRAIDEEGRLEGTRVKLGIAYDRFSSAGEEEVRQVIELARNHNASVVTTHLVAGPYGLDNSPEIVNSYDFLNTSIPLIFSHGSFITSTGVQLLGTHNQYISTCPESEMTVGTTHLHVDLFQDQAALGVDTHTGWSADMMTQARLLMSDVRSKRFSDVLDKFKVPKNNPLSANQVFLLATRHGGLALRQEDLGVIAVGAKADLVVWAADTSPSMVGWEDPVAAILLHASVGDVEHVLVDGEFVKKDFRLTAPDLEEVRGKFLAGTKRIQDIWESIPYPVLEGNFFGAGDYGDVEVVDTLRGPGTGYSGPNVD